MKLLLSDNRRNQEGPGPGAQLTSSPSLVRRHRDAAKSRRRRKRALIRVLIRKRPISILSLSSRLGLTVQSNRNVFETSQYGCEFSGRSSTFSKRHVSFESP